MTHFDWMIVLVLNGAVIAYGFYLALGTKTSAEWFLGRRALPWWMVGMSMFATNVDNADLVTNMGYSYSQGIHFLTAQTLATVIGCVLAAFWIAPAMYRAGLFTNAEYLEARFGPTTRVFSALIQIQYRTLQLGVMFLVVHLLMTELAGLNSAASWRLILGMVVLAALYTSWGGLRSVVATDALQALVMIAGTLVMFVAVWNEVGSWSELKQRLNTADARGVESGTLDREALATRQPADKLIAISDYRGKDKRTPPVVVMLGWIIVVCGYWTVNHTQMMRLMGTRSLWDMRMAAIFGCALSMPLMSSLVIMGLCGRALEPGLREPDSLFPLLANMYLLPGLKGLLVASVVAAAVSTFDSMGSALSAVFTRDVYARLIVPDGNDRHYVRVSRLATVGVLLAGFAYVPFLSTKQTLVSGFLTFVPVFVTPLFTIYLAGVFTPASRRSGLIGLIAGSAYGIVAFYDREIHNVAALPSWLTANSEAFCWSVFFTAAAVALSTLILGKTPSNDLAEPDQSGWLATSRGELPPAREHPFTHEIRWWQRPGLYATLFLAGAAYLIFGVLW